MLDRRSARATKSQRPAPGIAKYDVRRGLAIKASKPCKLLVYLVVHPSLVHFITLIYARTLHTNNDRATHVQMPRARHNHKRRASRAPACAHARTKMQARACCTLSTRRHPNRPQTWGGMQGAARAVGRKAAVARCSTARREPARTARAEAAAPEDFPPP